MVFAPSDGYGGLQSRSNDQGSFPFCFNFPALLDCDTMAAHIPGDDPSIQKALDGDSNTQHDLTAIFLSSKLHRTIKIKFEWIWAITHPFLVIFEPFDQNLMVRIQET